MLRVAYEDNGRARGKHIYGHPELVVRLPEEPTLLEELLELEKFAHDCCQDEEAEVDGFIELTDEGTFKLQVRGANDWLNYEIEISCFFTEAEIHLRASHIKQNYEDGASMHAE
jgi:hypothetical protein